ncbi:hypothetical protein CASFOL_011399 [Castilleja foliolosa]|uniref:Uncharacterized protein n=1 Tax=Castilleja foliolosa TaxID=1961234 RepID=A0ABD3DZ76_9LAMI
MKNTHKYARITYSSSSATIFINTSSSSLPPSRIRHLHHARRADFLAAAASASENVEPMEVEPQPKGAVVRVSGKGRGKRTHYESFEFNGFQYWLKLALIHN